MALKGLGLLGVTGGVTGVLMFAEKYLASNVDILGKLSEPSELVSAMLSACSGA